MMSKPLTEEQKKRNQEKQNEYRVNNPEWYMHNKAKRRALDRQIDFNIEVKDIVMPVNCPVFKKYKLKKEYSEKSGPKPWSPSLDRIDNSKGYVKGNIQVISNKANTMKGNATPEELLQFAFWIILTYGHLIDKEIN
jgi:hypothetical protein